MTDQFVEYYARRTTEPDMLARFQRLMDLVLRTRSQYGLPVDRLSVVDVGCNAGAQAELWARRGHTVRGLDINEELLRIAGERAAAAGLRIDYRIGTAEHLPWDDESADVCLLPELLEHVADWESCLVEACRILRPGGTLFLSTTNRLCPRQEEFDLPLYSWYPSRLKRYCERLAVTSRPQWVQHTRYPAVHWFSPYQLSDFLSRRGFDVQDRFDAIDYKSQSALARSLIDVVRGNRLLRFAAHVATPSTRLVATKRNGPEGADA